MAKQSWFDRVPVGSGSGWTNGENVFALAMIAYIAVPTLTLMYLTGDHRPPNLEMTYDPILVQQRALAEEDYVNSPTTVEKYEARVAQWNAVSARWQQALDDVEPNEWGRVSYFVQVQQDFIAGQLQGLEDLMANVRMSEECRAIIAQQDSLIEKEAAHPAATIGDCRKLLQQWSSVRQAWGDFSRAFDERLRTSQQTVNFVDVQLAKVDAQSQILKAKVIELQYEANISSPELH